jgi:hypothetical protein
MSAARTAPQVCTRRLGVTIRLFYHLPFSAIATPVSFMEDDARPSANSNVLHICAVETDANRPFFMHWLGQIYTI